MILHQIHTGACLRQRCQTIGHTTYKVTVSKCHFPTISIQREAQIVRSQRYQRTRLKNKAVVDIRLLALGLEVGGYVGEGDVLEGAGQIEGLGGAVEDVQGIALAIGSSTD